MEKLKIPNEKKVNQILNEEFISAMNDVEFKNVVSNLKLSEDIIRKNVTKIYDTIEELKKCKKCKGIYDCKNNYEGHVYYPEKYEDTVRFVYTPCKYMKKLFKELENKKTNESEIEKARMKDIDINDKKRVPLIKWLKKFYDEYSSVKTYKGLYLHGSFGAGKTFLISALFNELADKKNVTTEIVYFPELLRNLREDFDLLERKVNNLKYVDLLLIDDIGAENVTSWGRDEILGSILQYRMNKGLTTFFSSNLTIEELENHLAITKNNEDKVKARRIVQRIEQLTEKMELKAENKRK